MTRGTARFPQPGTQTQTADRATPMVAWPPGFRVSTRGFVRLCRDNPDLRLERDANGKVKVMSPTSRDGSRRNLEIAAQLRLWNRNTGLGVAFESSGGVTLPNTVVRAPDASWIALNRWNALTDREKRRFSPICPDFVMQLRSSSDAMAELRAKMVEYINQGVRLGWLIDPESRSVEIYRADGPVETLIRPAIVSGEPLLPGFNLNLRQVFDQ